MNKKQLLVSLLIFFALALVSWKAFADNGWVHLGSQQDWSIKTTNNGETYGIRFHDDEKDATCWVVHNQDSYNRGSNGISCLPDKDLLQ
jgi:hypothetical protein